MPSEWEPVWPMARKPGLRFDRPRSGKNFPMVLAGHQREGRRQHDDVGAIIAQLAEQFGEADVVADGAADCRVADLVGHDLLAAR